MDRMKKTPLYAEHTKLGAKIVDFSGWQMPIQYPKGIIAEHLATRTGAGLFDVSHMGRFRISGEGARSYLQAVLTNDCDKLEPFRSQYSILANENGGAIDDVFLYREETGDFLLVVNAANAEKDFDHLQSHLANYKDVQLVDVTEEMAMLALQGPDSEKILSSLVTGGELPEQKRNSMGLCELSGTEVLAARTGYTGEKICFEIFIPAESAPKIWSALVDAGAEPVGLGARDTLRLEAGLPLYGHELGVDPEGHEIPVLAIPQAKFAISLDSGRKFIGRAAIEKQAAALDAYKSGDYSNTSSLPKLIKRFRLTEKGIARHGCKVYIGDEQIGTVTSGTMVPYYQDNPSGAHSMKAVGLCMVSPQLKTGDNIEIEVRNRRLKANIVAGNMGN